MKNSYFLRIADDGLAELDTVSVEPGRCLLTRVIVPEKYRGQGYARRLMSEALREADSESAELLLEINPYGNMSFRQLENWYKRLGFKRSPQGFYVRHPA